jgi:hypothetical protein
MKRNCLSLQNKRRGTNKVSCQGIRLKIIGYIGKKSIINELKTFKKISDIFQVHQKDCAPKFLGETFFDDINVIKMEFINQTIEEAIKDYSKPLSLKDALIGMFDAV